MRETIYTFVDGNGTSIRVRLEIDEGKKLHEAVRHLAERALGKSTRVATALGGAVRVVVVESTSHQGGGFSKTQRIENDTASLTDQELIDQVEQEIADEEAGDR